MVIRNLFIFLLIICYSSCKIPLNEYGNPVRIKEKKYYPVPDSLYKHIDTLALYKLTHYELGGSTFTPKQQAIFRFFSKGKLIYYFGNDTLERNYFIPAKGQQGRYYVKNNKIFIIIYTAGEGFGHSSKSELYFYEKFMKEIDSHSRTYIRHYIKMKEVPIDWLEWQPDW